MKMENRWSYWQVIDRYIVFSVWKWKGVRYLHVVQLKSAVNNSDNREMGSSEIV